MALPHCGLAYAVLTHLPGTPVPSNSVRLGSECTRSSTRRSGVGRRVDGNSAAAIGVAGRIENPGP
jgi:hypothetical protein